jgi:hypothetical protein
MAIFTISYDLIKYKDYPKLWEALKEQKAHRVLESVWLLNANNTAEQVLNWLKSYVDKDDKLFVCETSVAKIWFSNAKLGTNNWLKENIRELV